MATLELLLCPDRWQGSELLLQRVAGARVEKQILIVPEQYSFSTECALLDAGGDTVSQYAEVLSFSRLANRVFSRYGGVTAWRLDKGGRLLLMQKTLESVRAQLKCFGSADSRPEQMLRILDVFDECTGAQVTPEQLKRAAQQLSGPLAVKVEELALIFSAYQANACRQDPSERLTALCEKLASTAFAEEYAFSVSQFIDFTGQELAVLEQLMQKAKRLTVCLSCDALDGDEPVFAPSRRSAQALTGLAQRLGVPVTVHRLAPGASKPPLAHLRQQLFGALTDSWPEETDCVSLLFAASPRRECLCVARRIRKLAASGVRYRQINLVCCDASYLPLLRQTLARYEIPVTESGSEPILDQPILALLLSALRAATGGMQQDDVFSYLKSSLSPLPRREVDALENYAIMWNIRGTMWRKPFIRNPGGMDARQSEAARQALQRLNVSRETGMRPIWSLADALQASRTTGEQVKALYAFLQEIGLQERLQSLTDAQIAAGQLEQAQQTAQLYETVVSALEQMYEILGQTERSPERFTDLLASLLAQYQISAIPATLDCVTLGAPASMQRQCSHLLLVGCAEGCLPASHADSGILTEQDRNELRALALPLTAGTNGVLERELEALYHIFSGAAESVFCAGPEAAPSYLLRRLAVLFPQAEQLPAQAPPFDGLRAEELAVEAFALPGETAAQLPAEVQTCMEHGRAAAGYRFGALSEETVRALYGTQLMLSASKVDCFYDCRFQYFLTYGLKLLARRQAEFDAPAFGNFVHAVLEHMARRVMAEGGFRTVAPARVEEITAEEIARYTREELQGLEGQEERFVYLYRRNEAEVLRIAAQMAEELSCSDFEPCAFELEFGGAGELPAIPVDGRAMNGLLTGKVDRVDLYNGERRYVRVVDYKTGGKRFDYTDVLEGVGLQMLLYLFVLERDGYFGDGSRSAGVLYFQAREPVISAETDDLEKKRAQQRRRSGLLLNNAEVLQAMEHCAENPQYLPYKVLKKTGEAKGDLATPQEFALLRRHVSDCLRNMADRLADGQVTPDPYLRGKGHSACDWCAYRDACHLDLDGAPRVRREVNAEEFWDSLERKYHGKD